MPTPNPKNLGIFWNFVDFGTGTGWKSFFDFFFGLILDPPPPGTSASTAKKGKFIGTGHFFPPWLGLFRKRGEWYWYTFFFSLIFRNDGKTFVFQYPIHVPSIPKFYSRGSCGCAGTNKKWFPMHALRSACSLKTVTSLNKESRLLLSVFPKQQ